MRFGSFNRCLLFVVWTAFGLGGCRSLAPVDSKAPMVAVGISVFQLKLDRKGWNEGECQNLLREKVQSRLMENWRGHGKREERSEERERKVELGVWLGVVCRKRLSPKGIGDVYECRLVLAERMAMGDPKLLDDRQFEVWRWKPSTGESVTEEIAQQVSSLIGRAVDREFPRVGKVYRDAPKTSLE